MRKLITLLLVAACHHICQAQQSGPGFINGVYKPEWHPAPAPTPTYHPPAGYSPPAKTNNRSSQPDVAPKTVPVDVQSIPENGEGRYTYPDGSKYYGNYLNGQRSGKGSLFGKGFSYEGEWANDKYNGHGVIKYTDYEEWTKVTTETGSYDGNFKNGKMDGKGTLKMGNTRYTGLFKDGKKQGMGTEHSPDGTYTGYFDSNVKNGAGTLVKEPNRDQYIGTWVNDVLNGPGTIRYQNGNLFTGSFINGQINGTGKICDPSDKVLQKGYWQNDVFFGDQPLHIMPDGARYFGSLKDDKKTGEGVYTYANGSIYRGHFSNDLPNGKGKYEAAGGGSYDGDWVDGRWEGQGTRIMGDMTYTGTFKNNAANGHLKITGAKGLEYEGDFTNEMYNGKGTAHKDDGSVWTGDWVNGDLVSGTKTWASGETYTGNFKSRKLDGTGSQKFPNGYTYQGNFVEGHLNGHGTILKPNGEKYDGNCLDDRANGQGTWTNTLGARYVGEWFNGDRNGYGEYDSAGTVLKGYWSYGKPPGAGAQNEAVHGTGSNSAVGVKKDEPGWAKHGTEYVETEPIKQLRQVIESGKNLFADLKGGLKSKRIEKGDTEPTRVFAAKMKVEPGKAGKVIKYGIIDYGTFIAFEEEVTFTSIAERDDFINQLRTLIPARATSDSYGSHLPEFTPLSIRLGSTSTVNNAITATITVIRK